MGKKRKHQNPRAPPKKNSNIKSNSLVPARSYGERPSMAFAIKREEDTQHTNTDTSSSDDVEDAVSYPTSVHNTINYESSNHNESSNSTATELMEIDQRIADNTQSQNFGENQVVPLSFISTLVKREPTNLELPCNPMESSSQSSQDSTISSLIPESVLSNITDISSDNPPHIKSEPLERDEISTCTTIECSPNLAIKFEPVENSSCNQELAEKRKAEESLNEIRKRFKAVAAGGVTREIKKEPDEASDNEDVAILPVPIIKKSVPLICISDDESQDVDMETNENFLVLKPNTKQFSTDTLKYFNIMSELDRFECKSALDDLLKNRTKRTRLEEMFPIIKKENKNPREIKAGDILFKKSEIDIYCDTEHPASSHVACNISNRQISQPESEYINLSVPSSSSSTASSLRSPSLPSTSRFDENPTSSQAGAISAILNSDAAELPFSFQDIQEALRFYKTSIPTNGSTSVASSELGQQPVQDPRFQFRLESESRNQVSTVLNTQTPVLLQPTVQSALRYDAPSTSQQSEAFPLQPATLPATQSFKVNPVGNMQLSEKLPNHEFQKLALCSASISSSVPAFTRDPRLAKKHNKVEMFAPRKGVGHFDLYRKIGTSDVTKHLKFFILQWNPAWIKTQLRTGNPPPICDNYPVVKYSYLNENDYYNTYLPLHLLDVWFTLFNNWKNSQMVVIACIVHSFGTTENFFTYHCANEMEDSQVWPKGGDIALCEFDGEEFFVKIDDVKKKPTDVHTKVKLRISLNSLHDLKLKSGNTIKLSILLNIRTAFLMTEALRMIHPNLKNLVLNPELHKDDIKIVMLHKSKPIKQLRDDILNAAFMNRVRAIVVQTDELQLNNQGDLMLVLITMITYAMVNSMRYNLVQGKKTKVLVLLKNNDLLLQLYKRLAQYNPILAVRTKQFQLSDHQLKCTLEDKLERKEKLADIFNKHDIFLTTFSALGKSEIKHLSRHDKWNCIIYDAHMCTEVETALPMTLQINRLFLLGNIGNSIPLEPLLHAQNYHLTFYDRLLKVKQ